VRKSDESTPCYKVDDTVAWEEQFLLAFYSSGLYVLGLFIIKKHVKLRHVSLQSNGCETAGYNIWLRPYVLLFNTNLGLLGLNLYSIIL